MRTRPALTRPTLLAAAVGALLAIGGCSAEAPQVPAPVTQTADITTDKVAPPPPQVPVTWPLTGVETAEVAARPALAVKIENPVSVRPQTGLDAADIVWEQVVEGGVTRFVVVFHSTLPDEVGPIRSVRPMDPAIAAPLHGVIAFSGGQPRFVSALADAGLQVVSHDAGDDGFWRRSGIGAPHNVFGRPTTFLDQADPDHTAAPPPQFAYALRPDLATVATTGAPTTSVAVTMSSYSRPGWTWDPATAAWLRTEKGTPATAASGARLAAANVVVLRVDLVDSGTRDPSGAVVPETLLEGTGEALVATGGRTLAATWNKGSVTEPLRLTTADGEEVRLAPGVTWVELVPNGSGAVSVG
ncbi:DUF3048 domain-containing protein [uncultured Cellulomonas sp.]|uniref:DUF3048 domain-containing protein n=1 Tax=uncultured Cellulomonas sp. TaxID=189682 RepID=UPI00260734E3|nr:DUF3048 domain-containing protein [uncultured Cellulomonas sp.]